MMLIMTSRTFPYLTGRFFDGISSGLFMMALPWMILQQPNMGTFVALTALACTVLSFLLTPFFSTLIDRHSRKRILVWVQFGQAATASVVFSAYLLHLGSTWLLAVAQLIFWVTSNLAWATNNAFTQENFRPQEYASISGKQEIIMQGTTLGAGALGVVLLDTWGMLEFALFAAIASSIATISYLVTPYKQQLRVTQNASFLGQLAESKQIFSSQPHFYLFLMMSCLSYPILTYLGKLIPIWFAEVGISGEWLAAYNIAFGIGSLFTGVFVARLLVLSSHPNLMIYSMAAATFALLGMSFSIEPVYLIAFTLVFGFFNALNRIARTNWMHHTIAIEQRGRADGALAMFATSVQSISYIAIALLSHWNITQLGFVLAALVLMLAIMVMLKIHKQGGVLEPLMHSA